MGLTGDNLSGYLAGLGDERRRDFAELSGRIASVTGDAGGAASFVFVAGRAEHDLYSDAPVVFWQAAQQLAGDAEPGELPLLFVGYHGKVRLGRRRLAQGFLLTDARLLAQDRMAVFGEQPAARSIPLADAADDVVDEAWRLFDLSWFERLGTASDLAKVREVLSASVAEVLVWRADHGLGQAVSNSEDQEWDAARIVDRARELGIADAIKTPSPSTAKHIGRLCRALDLPLAEQVIFTVSDSTLAGPYGLAVTDCAVWSVDRGEPPVSTPRETVSTVAIDGDRLDLGAGQTHTLPNHLRANEQEALATLLTEVLLS